MENCSINLPDDSYYSLIDKECRKVVGSCNGLVCLLGYSLTRDDDGQQEMWLRLWNPATRTISDKLGYIYFRDDMYQLQFWKFAFGYDNSTDTYKVVALHMGGDDITPTTEVQVLSFGNNAWRNIQSFPAMLAMLCFPDTQDYSGVHLNCTANWLAIFKKGNLVVQFVIISLDLGTETHTRLLPPPGSQGHLCMVGVCVLMDSLCFYHDIKRTDIVIWKMTKFRDEKSWTQFLKFNNHNLQMEMTRGLSCINLYENGDILVFTDDQYHQGQAILYNWRNSTVVKLKTRDNESIFWSSINNYVESLVSTR
jgi:F-box interacting protein